MSDEDEIATKHHPNPARMSIYRSIRSKTRSGRGPVEILILHSTFGWVFGNNTVDIDCKWLNLSSISIADKLARDLATFDGYPTKYSFWMGIFDGYMSVLASAKWYNRSIAPNM